MLKKFFTQLKKYKLSVEQRFININIFHLKITLIACVKNGFWLMSVRVLDETKIKCSLYQQGNLITQLWTP